MAQVSRLNQTASPLLTERDLALRFAADAGDSLIWDERHQRWLMAFNRMWREPSPNALVRKMDALVAQADKKLQRFHAVEQAIKYSAAHLNQPDFKEDPTKAGLPDGNVFDLDAYNYCQTRQHTVRTLGAVPDFNNPPARWLQFLAESLPQDNGESARYAQRFLGYALTGLVREHKFLLLIGTGRNGKGVFIRVAEALLGGYAASIPPKALLANYNEHPQWKMALLSARLSCVPDMAEGSWKAAELKLLTGGDRIVANWMRGNNIAFDPTHKFILGMNRIPDLKQRDPALEQRMVVLRFPFNFEASGRADPKLTEALKRELPGITAWALAGARDYLKHGLGPEPTASRQEVAAYAAEQDEAGAWIDDHLVVRPDCWVMRPVLNKEARKVRPGFDRLVKEELARRGYTPQKSPTAIGEKQTIGYRGLAWV